MNPTPLPQPSAYTCPNCGAPLAGEMPFCPQCGASLRAPASQSSGCLTVGAQVILGMVAGVLGLCGACFTLLGGAELNQGGWGFAGVGLGMLVVAGLCIWGIVRLAKR